MHHILFEVRLDVFMNNWISALLDSGNGVAELRGLERWVSLIYFGFHLLLYFLH
jgi:hypothetical protein